MEWNTEYYRRNLPHIGAYDRPMFITFGTKRRRRLPPCARNLVLERCVFGHLKHYWLHVVVVMPDHVHLVLTIPTGPGGLAWKAIMKAMKGTAARAVNKLLGSGGIVWQPESFDRVIRSGKETETIDYILENPVRAGLVERWEKYPWTWIPAQTGMSALHVSR
ncbi:MAG TPA: transposase [Thermoanaerobaculia bacterium]